MTHVTGAERCSEALQKLQKKYDIVVNIQGDEPLIELEIIDGIVKALQVCLWFYPVFYASLLVLSDFKLSRDHVSEYLYLNKGIYEKCIQIGSLIPGILLSYY